MGRRVNRAGLREEGEGKDEEGNADGQRGRGPLRAGAQVKGPIEADERRGGSARIAIVADEGDYPAMDRSGK